VRRAAWAGLVLALACSSDSQQGASSGAPGSSSSGSSGATTSSGASSGSTTSGGSSGGTSSGVSPGDAGKEGGVGDAGPGDGGVPSYAEGTVRFVPYLTSDSGYLPFIDNPNPAQQVWMRGHFARMFAFTPYFDSRLSWSPPAWAYKDSYAIYPSAGPDDMGLDNAAQYILKDGQGNRLFIPFGCGGGTCPQYAADVGDPAYRALWIAQAKRTLAKGYRGLHVDDVNLEWRIGDGNGNEVLPLDPRTGAAMTLSNWRRYMAEFMEAIRAAFPTSEIVHNSLWWVPDSDPWVARQLRAADSVNLERGVVDDGLTGGNGTFALETLLGYVDRRHAEGGAALFFAYGTTEAQCEYNLAAYFLASNGKDGLTCLYRNKPNDFWPGYDSALGAATGPRTKLASGVLARSFARGRVLLGPPGMASTTVQLGGTYTDLRGQKVSSVQVSAKSGVVLRSP
jgi:SAM-dependent methyltransferase